MPLRGQASAGSEHEADLAIVEPRAQQFGAAVTTDAEAKHAAERLLASRRSASHTLAFASDQPVAAGHKVKLTPASTDAGGTASYDGECFVTHVLYEWSQDDGRLQCRVTAVPADATYALPRRTPKPRIDGACLATVTGPPGEEVHCDKLGRVRLRFHWDRFGPEGPHSETEATSLAVRVLQPNLASSLLLPRIGWEVLVMFEGGDPDRPYVLGRLDNGKHRPAVSLPDNKTISQLGTFSSPGGNGRNSLRFDDAAGQQAFAIVAAKGMSRTVGGNMLMQTVNVDEQKVDGSQAVSIGGTQTIAVQQGALVDSCASQTIDVGADQSFKTPAAMALSAGSVSVTAATLSEQVGSPGGSLGELAQTATFTAASSLGPAGMALSALAKAGKAAYAEDGEAISSDGLKAAGKSLLTSAAGVVPGVNTLVDIGESAGIGPWKEKQVAKGKGGRIDGAAAVGGAQAGNAAQQSGGGNRTTSIDGSLNEAVGGAYLVNTPGSSSWTTLGLSKILVGGSHATAAGVYSTQTLGAAAVTAATVNIKSAGLIARNGRWLKVSVGGALSATSGADTVISAGGGLSLTAGALKLEGATVVLECGDSKVTIAGGGIVAEAAVVTFSASAKVKEASR